jgi:hypothetical protein
MPARLDRCRATVGYRTRPVLSMSGKTRHKRSPDRLLLISCSNRKRAGSRLMPAIDRYDGPAFYVLRRYLRETDDRQLRVYILSAEFGIINARKRIPDYDRFMTHYRARELRQQTTRSLRLILQKTQCTEVFVCAGTVYEDAIDIPHLKQTVSVQVAARGQGRKLSSLHSWLRQRTNRRMAETKESNFEQEIAASLQRHPHIFLRLMQNSLMVAESLRDNYFITLGVTGQILTAAVSVGAIASHFTCEGAAWRPKTIKGTTPDQLKVIVAAIDDLVNRTSGSLAGQMIFGRVIVGETAGKTIKLGSNTIFAPDGRISAINIATGQPVEVLTKPADINEVGETLAHETAHRTKSKGIIQDDNNQTNNDENNARVRKACGYN